MYQIFVFVLICFFFLYIIHKNSLMFYSHFQCVYNIYIVNIFFIILNFHCIIGLQLYSLTDYCFFFHFLFFRNKNSNLLKMFKILQNTNFLNSLRYPFQLTFGKLWIFLFISLLCLHYLSMKAFFVV